MKKNRPLLAKILTLCIAGVASTAFAATCPTAPYSVYIVPGFSCTLGILTFSNLAYVGTGNPNGIAIPASAVNVTPITTPGNEGFQFSVNMSVSSSGGSSTFQDDLITMLVSAATPAITGATLSFSSTFTGTGVTGVTENLCPNHDLIACPNTKQIAVFNPAPSFTSSTTFPAAMSLSVSKDANATSGVNGTAAVPQFSNTFANNCGGSCPTPVTPTPLPPSFFLALTGLAMAGGFYHFRRKFARS